VEGKTFVTQEKVTNDPPMTLILSLIGLGSFAYDAVESIFDICFVAVAPIRSCLTYSALDQVEKPST
jgi:hypothetical protein